MYQLIASDLDGTLLNNEHMVDAYTAETLQTLEKSGIQFVIATGRHYLDVMGIRDVLGVRAHLITSNGARIHSPENKLIHEENIEPNVVQALAQAEFAAGTLLNFYLDDAWLIDQHSQYLLDMHQDSGFTYQISDLARHHGQGVAKVLYIGDHAHLLTVEHKLRERFGNTLYITFSMPDCLEVMAASVSKGHALQVVLERLKMSASQCIAFGDGQNDLELLQTAGHPRLMSNANPRLVAALPDVLKIGSNEESGVAKHLRTLFQIAH
ncbi:Cof-type HAD-IIB family hydrolase [Iodobacter sp. LRB]|uniref:Cof-type HAD-IIB family hydrolase n=1 Tax=unclassified Iodobacter TaxID=235634 RepID=UPI000C0E2DF4|nr:Cof-type HAD-IIB family hydrolase [Iodobacter sp. BJB302]PHV00125.1 hydrolase [Iodobacter sp. BJB302]